MAIPIKPNIGTKSNLHTRPNIPVSQKENATEFNLLVSSIRANYERLILNWDTDIAVNTILEVNQYVLFTGVIYRITTSYDVGDPLTWNAANAVSIGGSSGGGTWGSITGNIADQTDLIAILDAIATDILALETADADNDFILMASLRNLYNY
jgi:hypothetical protein